MVLNEKLRSKIAEEIATYWKYNCTDEEFHYNCADTVHEQLLYRYCITNEQEFEKESKIIINLINEVYSKDNWKAIKFFENSNNVIVQNNEIMINNIMFNHVWYAELNYNIVILYDTNRNEIANMNFYDIEDIEVIK